MNTNDPASVRLNDLEYKILCSCATKALGVKDLGTIHEVGYSSGDMKRAITHLLQLKFIEYKFPEFHRSYSQRYKTTREGKRYVR